MTNENRTSERVLAEQKMTILMQMSKPINILAADISELPDTDEQKLLRRPLGELMLLIYDLMLPIIRSHPDLDPDK